MSTPAEIRDASAPDTENEMPGIYVPNYMSFNNDNIFIGSYQGLRFKLSPNVADAEIRAEYWYGPLCYEKSTMDGVQLWPLTDEGIADMTTWLEALSKEPPPAPQTPQEVE